MPANAKQPAAGSAPVYGFAREEHFLRRLGKDLMRNRTIYAMMLPVAIYYIVFHYFPLYGLQIAFKDFSATTGIWASPWAGFKHFISFVDGYYFWRLIRNTFLINVYELLFAFPAPIILALLLNELRRIWMKRFVQTVSYLPHFISIVVVVGMLADFLARDGLINQVAAWFGADPLSYLQEAQWFRTIYVASGIWQGIGWGSIIYLAAIANIDPTLYEAATVDGAGRFRQVLHITLPGILPITIILFILQIGSMMSVGHEKILLMYSPITYETADVISTYVYRKGILEADYSYSAAVGLFNSLINFALLVLANRISRRVTQTSLW